MIKSLLRKLRVFCCIVTNRGAVIPMRIGANAQLQIYLCQRDTSTAWVNPGGKVRRREDPMEAAKREAVCSIFQLLLLNISTREGVMVVEQELPMSDYEEGRKGRQRKWFTVEEAMHELDNNEKYSRRQELLEAAFMAEQKLKDGTFGVPLPEKGGETPTNIKKSS